MTQDNAREASELARLYVETVPRAMREFRRQMRHARTPLSMAQFRILGYLHGEAANNRTLAERHGASVAAMSRLLSGLIRQGYIKRQPLASDRRQVLITLTPSGRRCYERFRQEARVRMTTCLSRLTVDAGQELRCALRVLDEVIEQIGAPAPEDK